MELAIYTCLICATLSLFVELIGLIACVVSDNYWGLVSKIVQYSFQSLLIFGIGGLILTLIKVLITFG